MASELGISHPQSELGSRSSLNEDNLIVKIKESEAVNTVRIIARVITVVAFLYGRTLGTITDDQRLGDVGFARFQEDQSGLMQNDLAGILDYYSSRPPRVPTHGSNDGKYITWDSNGINKPEEDRDTVKKDKELV